MRKFIDKTMKIAIVLFLLIISKINAEEGVAGSELIHRPKRIYYGTNASITSFPYYAAIEFEYGGLLGGSSIISDRFVLTAAHVFDIFMVWGGEENMEDYPEVDSTDGYPYDSTTTSYLGDYPTELALNNLVDGPRLDEPSILPSKPDSDNFVDGPKLNARTVPSTESDSNNLIDGTYKPYVAPRGFLIRAGSDARERGGSTHKVEYIKIHPDYVQNDGANGTINDIALVRVVNPFAFDQFRKPIPLFDASVRIRPGTAASVVGFGWTEHGSTHHLKNTTIWVDNRTRCERIYSNKNGIPIAKSAFCAGGGRHGKRDTCAGDSGGPLVIMKRLAGITSFGNGKCGVAGVPALYTEVSQFRSWIENYVPVF